MSPWTVSSGWPAMTWAGRAASAATTPEMIGSSEAASGSSTAAIDAATASGSAPAAMLAFAAACSAALSSARRFASATESTTIVRAAMSCHALRRGSTKIHRKPMYRAAAPNTNTT